MLLSKTIATDLFGGQLQGEGLYFDLSDQGTIFDQVDVRSQVELQNFADEQMGQGLTNWGVSNFGEKRERFFRVLDAKQMVDEQRFWHLGLDVWMPVNSKLLAPLLGTVVEAEYEAGFGNYGGYVVLEHQAGLEKKYTFYGHLNPRYLPVIGSVIRQGEVLGYLGDMTQNGGYFFHLHFQVLTEKGYKEGFVHKGYSTKTQFSEIECWVLDPLVGG